MTDDSNGGLPIYEPGDFPNHHRSGGIDHWILDRRLEKGERGAVLPPPWGVGAPTAGIAMRQIDIWPWTADELRVAILFFDWLDTPITNAIRAGDIGGFGLREFGVLGSSKAVWKGEFSTHGVDNLAYRLFAERDEQDPGRWSIWQTGGREVIPYYSSAPNLGLRLRLQNALIVPSAEVPFEDVLSFKQSRRSELLALRHYMEDVCIRIAHAQHDRQIANLEIEKFDSALADYLGVLRERNWLKSMVDLEVSFNWAAAGTGMVTGATALVGGGMPIASALLGSLVAAVPAGLSVNTTAGISGRVPGSPFAYLASIVRRL